MKITKKLFAFALALVMLLTLCPSQPTYAATKKATLEKSVTLTVGAKKTLKVKNLPKNAKVTWKSNKKSVATVSSKGVVKGVKAGKAKVVCKVTPKNKKAYNLTCSVIVKKAAVKKSISKMVSSQKELESALKAANVTKITIKTDAEMEFVIPAGTYNKIALVVDAPNADVVNNGTFKSIDIKAIKPNTWKENASGNSIKITAVDARIVVEAGASLENVTVKQDGGKIKIEAKGDIGAIEIAAPVIIDLNVDGKVGEVAVKAAAVVTVAGNTKEAVPISVSEEAKGADVSSSAPVEVKAEADISLTLNKGAEGSKVESVNDKTQIAVKNDSAENIKVTTPNGDQEVTTGTSSKVNPDGTKSDTTTTNPGYIYTSPDPLAVTGTMVSSLAEVRVYFNQTLPADVSPEQIKITAQDGTEVQIESVERGENDTHAYFIYVEEGALRDGKYNIELTVSGNKYNTSFVYDGAVWGPLNAALEIVNAEFDKPHTASSSAMQSKELCRVAFERDLSAEIAKDVEASKVMVTVETRDFKYEEIYPEAAAALPENHRMVSIWVGLRYGESAVYMTNHFSEFVCTGDPFVVAAPDIVCATKTTMVIKVAPGYEYAFVKENEDVASDNIEWYSAKHVWTDELGNWEVYDLDPEETYTVYSRVDGLTPVASAQTYKLNEQQDETSVIIKNNQATVTVEGNVVYDAQNNYLKLNVPLDPNNYFKVYGNKTWANDLKLNRTIGFPNDVTLLSWMSANVSFARVEAFGVGIHTFTMTYKLEVADQTVMSKIVTVQFEITNEELAQIQSK